MPPSGPGPAASEDSPATGLWRSHQQIHTSLEALLLQLPPTRDVRENISTGPLPVQMTEPSKAAGVRENASAGHLSVHVEGDHPVDVPFLFEQPAKHIAPAAMASFVSHVLIVVAVVLFIRFVPHPVTTAAFLPDQPNQNIIWLSQPGPGGGGGGGGNKMKEPPRKAENRGDAGQERSASDRAVQHSCEADRRLDRYASRRDRSAAWTADTFPRFRHWRRRWNRHRHGHRSRIGIRSRTRERRRHWGRDLSPGQRRHHPARAARSEAAVHIRCDARKGAGDRPARVCRPL
jgi:hypothetical protein